MSYVKMFESFINEANELIKAQGDCKAAIFQAQKEVDKFLNDLMKAGFITSFKSTVSPYNQGYELKLQVNDREMWKKKDPTPQEDFVLNWVSANGYIYLQPSSFFQGNFEEGKGAYLEGVVFQMEEKGKREYPRYDVKEKGDITKATKEFVKVISDQIADARKKAGI
jgi:hypothetical protein